VKILGIGTDIVNITRIESIYNKYGTRFLDKILHPEEILQFNMLAEHKKNSYLAKRFAAKEAVAKALGFGIGEISFRDIAVLNNTLGAPVATFKGDKQSSKYNVHLSLSDDHPFAVAFVVISH
jgi:holo-[acyl-carrier protein] synthase